MLAKEYKDILVILQSGWQCKTILWVEWASEWAVVPKQQTKKAQQEKFTGKWDHGLRDERRRRGRMASWHCQHSTTTLNIGFADGIVPTHGIPCVIETNYTHQTGHHFDSSLIIEYKFNYNAKSSNQDKLNRLKWMYIKKPTTIQSKCVYNGSRKNWQQKVQSLKSILKMFELKTGTFKK